MNDSSIREHTVNTISLNIATETSLKKNVIITAHGNKSHIIVKYFGCHSTVLVSAYVLTLHTPDCICENQDLRIPSTSDGSQKPGNRK